MKKITLFSILAIFILSAFTIGHQFPCKIIKKMSIPHCKKGPDACKKCKKNTKEEWCLLNVCPEKQGEIQRPVTKVTFHGQEHMKEYEVIQKFKTEEEAKKYSVDNKIEIQAQ